jgi:hypothetical protein
MLLNPLRQAGQDLDYVLVVSGSRPRCTAGAAEQTSPKAPSAACVHAQARHAGAAMACRAPRGT